MSFHARRRVIRISVLLLLIGIFTYIIISNPAIFAAPGYHTVDSVNGNVAAVSRDGISEVARNPWPDLKVGDQVIVSDDYKAGPSIIEIVGRQ